MNLERIKKARSILGEEVSNSLDLVGTADMRLLCESVGMLVNLIKRLQNPKQAKLDDKKFNSKIWKD